MTDSVEGDAFEWRALAQHEGPLAVFVDVDGTLVEFDERPRALDSEALGALAQLAAAPSVKVIVVTGRRWEDIAPHLASVPGVALVAEHGALGRWTLDEPRVDLAPAVDLSELAATFDALVARAGAGRVERKTRALSLHFRGLPPETRAQLEELVEPWIEETLDRRPLLERLAAKDAIEVRLRASHKGNAVHWVRRRLGDECASIALGDDVTDEDLFEALSDRDLAVRVDAGADGPRLESPAEVRAFLSRVATERARARRARLVPRTPRRASLVVASNRVPARSAAGPDRKRSVGGLVSALEPALEGRGALWVGWSGRAFDTLDQGPRAPFVHIDPTGHVGRAQIDLTTAWVERYYAGLSNGGLWPLLHGFVERARWRSADWVAYREVNEAFAHAIATAATPTAPVWIHDYHLLATAEFLRARGHRGPIGLFLHVPFPSASAIETMPWATELHRGMAHFDLVGFQTKRDADHYRESAALHLGARRDGATLVVGAQPQRVESFPIGTTPEDFRVSPETPLHAEVQGLLRQLAGRRLVLGVDRLDYTKGIVARMRAFELFLTSRPERMRAVSLVQVAVPSRGDVPDYAELRQVVEKEVGRINGELGDADWVPIRYLHRSYERPALAQLYAASDVCWVTPLRDGMNLVAKEYVAAQRESAPGVLVLSKFAGAAEQLGEGAILTNPFSHEELAHDLGRAIALSLDERRALHRKAVEVVTHADARRWATSFLEALVACGVR